MEELPLFTSESSWGIINIREDGSILSIENPYEGEEENYLFNIEKIDLQEYYKYMATRGWSEKELREVGCIDILEVGFWKKDNSYEHANETFRKEVCIDKIIK